MSNIKLNQKKYISDRRSSVNQTSSNTLPPIFGSFSRNNNPIKASFKNNTFNGEKKSLSRATVFSPKGNIDMSMMKMINEKQKNYDASVTKVQKNIDDYQIIVDARTITFAGTSSKSPPESINNQDQRNHAESMLTPGLYMHQE